MLTETKLSIVVPCYNEAANLPGLFAAFARHLDRGDVEVIFVNNGSSDDSAAILARENAKHAFSRVVTVAVNQGYGYGILAGLDEAKGEFLGWTHADLQTDPGDVLKALEILDASKEPTQTYVKGDRKGRPLFDQIFTLGMSAFESFYLRASLWDINAQPNIFHRDFFAEWRPSAPHDFSLDLYVLYRAKKSGIEVVRFPVVFPERQHGESSWNTGLAAKWKFIKRTLSFSRQLKGEL